MLVAAFPEWSALIQHFTEAGIVLRRKTKNEQSPAILILSYLSSSQTHLNERALLSDQNQRFCHARSITRGPVRPKRPQNKMPALFQLRIGSKRS